jgi:ATP-dependent DNA helicase RecQ
VTAPELDLHTPLRRLFGFPGFLPGQEDVVRSALAGRDTLALMPTGSGKSLPYQLAAMLRPSPTLVVSPLIALMKDQVDKLPPAVAAQASVINSSLEPGEAGRRLEAFAAGGVKLLYAAPERLRQRAFVSALTSAGVGLVVVDEVHCVSMWGHDFRPDYLFIRAALTDLGEPPVLGLTATATHATETEIGRALGRPFAVVRASVVRPNLHHAVDSVDSEEDRRRQLLERLREANGPVIVYARARKKCEELSRLLCGHGVRAEHYHAGLDAAERTRVQEAFVADDVPVVVATTAFGMGIDKPDIRLVLLYNLPGSLEDYVQMVGRAGRDGAPSRCVLFAGGRDANDLRRFARSDVPAPEALRTLYRRLRDAAAGSVALIRPEDLSEEDDGRVLVGMLEQAGLVRRGYDAGRALEIELLTPPPDVAERMAGLLDRYERQALGRVARIVSYSGSRRCRQVEIAEHFGEGGVAECGSCDRCAPARVVGVVAFADDEAPRMPEDVAATILGAAAGLRWPLGVGGLVAMLSGSVAAPPSARRSSAFGALAGATPTAIRRWLSLLIASGHLERYESHDGYPLLRVARTDDPPRITAVPAAAAPDGGPAPSPADEALFERLRAWRRETADAQSVPAFVVLADRTLRALAAARPGSSGELAAVPGIGPAKLERYGPALLELVEEAPPG